MLAGAYSITVTDNNGCTAFSGANVVQPQQGLNVAVNVTDPVEDLKPLLDAVKENV